MRTASFAQLVAAWCFLLSLSGCDEQPTSAVPLVRSIEVSHPSLRFTESLQSERIEVVVKDQTGAHVDGAQVTWSSGHEGVATVTSSGVVTALANGEATITVLTEGALAYVPVVVESPATPLADGVAATEVASAQGGWRYFTFDVPSGASQRVLQLSLEAQAGIPPSLRTDWCSTAEPPLRPDARQLCVIGSPPEGTQTIGIHAFRAYEGVSVEARMLPVTELIAGDPIMDLAADAGEVVYFNIELPQGSKLQLTAEGSSGNVDLFGWPGDTFPLDVLYTYDPANYWGWGNPEDGWCKAVDGTTLESCTTTAASETVRVTVVLVGVEAFSGFSLTADVIE